MMGKTHMAIGAAAYTVIVQPPSNIDSQAIPWAIGLGIAVLASIAPDIDNPKTTIGKILMPIIPSWLRPAAFSIVGGLLLWHGYHNTNNISLVVGFLLFCFSIMRHRNSPTHSLIGMLFIAAVTYIYLPTYLNAVLIGYGSHLIADTLTKQGVPYLWPLPISFKLPLFSTKNGFVETVLIRYGAIGIMIYYIF